jgi:hypothetical protein
MVSRLRGNDNVLWSSFERSALSVGYLLIVNQYEYLWLTISVGMRTFFAL